jgi:hypothetical protein
MRIVILTWMGFREAPGLGLSVRRSRARSLLLAVKCIQHALPPFLIERRQERVCDAHDSKGCPLRQ